MVDLAYPIPEFEALRLASRYSKGARIETTPTSIVITWDQLASSRSYFPTKGNVSATVWLTAMPDGRSILMKCEIRNGTYFRTCGFVAHEPICDVNIMPSASVN